APSSEAMTGRRKFQMFHAAFTVTSTCNFGRPASTSLSPQGASGAKAMRAASAIAMPICAARQILFQRFDLRPQPFILFHFAPQETLGHRHSLADALRREHIDVAELVLCFPKVREFDRAPASQLLEAIIDLAKADAELFRNF